MASCQLVNLYFDHYLATLRIAGLISVIYYAAMQLWVAKDKAMVKILIQIKKRNH